MNRDIVKIPLLDFKKGKRQVFVDFVENIVKWKDETYPIDFIEIEGNRYPYVIMRNIKPLSEIKPLIKAVNFHKEDLKRVEYEVNGHVYFVVGIGPIAIQAIKDDAEEPEFFRFLSTEGQVLLNELMDNLKGQQLLEAGIEEIL